MKTFDEAIEEISNEAKINPERIRQIINDGISYKDNPIIMDNMLKMATMCFFETITHPEIDASNVLVFHLLNAFAFGVFVGMRMERSEAGIGE